MPLGKTPAKKAAAQPAKPALKPVPSDPGHRYMPANMDDIVRVLWYGDPGFGKTTAMATLANVGPVWFLDPEQRMKQSALRRQGINLENVTRITDCRYGPLKKLFEQIGNEVADDVPVAGVLWDAATEQQRVMTQNLVDEAVVSANSKGMERSEYKTYLDEYGDMTEQFRRLMRQLFRIPIHIGVTAHAQRDTDENDKIKVGPDMTKAFKRDLIAAMDIITYMQMEAVGQTGIERAGLCVPLGRYEAKDAFGVLPRRVVDPTFERILGYVAGDITASNDAVQKAARQARRDAETQATKED